MDKEKINSLFERVLNDYKSSAKTEIVNMSSEIDEELSELDKKINGYQRELEKLLNS